MVFGYGTQILDRGDFVTFEIEVCFSELFIVSVLFRDIVEGESYLGGRVRARSAGLCRKGRW